MKLLKSTTWKKSRPSAGPGYVCVDRVRLDHPSKFNHALRTHEGPSNHSVHTEEAQGENESGAIVRIATQKSRHAISSIAEQETIGPSCQTACADQAEVGSCDNTTKWNQKRKRSSKTTAGDQIGEKGSLSSSSEDIHHTCGKHTHAECIRNRNPIQQPASAPSENQFDPADIDRMITRLCPRPQKLVLEANSTDLDKTLQTVSINHDISQDDCFPQYRARAVATGSLANQGITTTSPPLLTATPLPNANPPSVVSSLSPPQTI